MCTCWGKQRQWGKASSSVNSSEPFPSRAHPALRFLLCRKHWKSHPTHWLQGKHCMGQRETQTEGEWREGGSLPMNSQDLWKCAMGESNDFTLTWIVSPATKKISARKRGGGFADCRTQAGPAAAHFPLWEAHWSRKQPDRKRTGVLTSAAGSRVLRQSNLSCWKQKCDLTFYSNVNTFNFFI